MQRLQQKIEKLEEKLKLMAEEVKAKSEGKLSINLMLHCNEVNNDFMFSL